LGNTSGGIGRTLCRKNGSVNAQVLSSGERIKVRASNHTNQMDLTTVLTPALSCKEREKTFAAALKICALFGCVHAAGWAAGGFSRNRQWP